MGKVLKGSPTLHSYPAFAAASAEWAGDGARRKVIEAPSAPDKITDDRCRNESFCQVTAPLVLIVLEIIVYSNTLSVAFYLDDLAHIQVNFHIRLMERQ